MSDSNSTATSSSASPIHQWAKRMGHGSVKGTRLRKVPGPTNCRDADLETGNHRELGALIALCDGLRHLHFGVCLVAMEVGTLAKEDVKVRKLVGGLGVIPVLVSMEASEVVARRRAAVSALIEPANGTYTCTRIKTSLELQCPGIKTTSSSRSSCLQLHGREVSFSTL
ncbi:hypothetical protein L3X38_004880 [Prunus dulcis]|uniref:Uncharacterized protein n=1 Tax=Prunus dulcis TaxID=3755 RepID=A0AAD4ZPV1_PRUDU|nr:hypothetical protein L3X38_004880 [Prunus dulcis]